MIDLTVLETESRNPNSMKFSSMGILESVKLMNSEDINSVRCIESQYQNIANLIENTSEVLKNGGRIVYIGAGTSGRLGILDAVECPPTFGVDNDRVIGLMAGGDGTFSKAKEGVEDSIENAVNDLNSINFSDKDILIGIAASGRTPYVLGAIEFAKSIGALTGCVVCVTNSEIAKNVDFPIEVVPGPEVLTGSTRLKAGTSTKLVLNMISTISMKEQGKVFENYMVDLKLSNQKLQQRGLNILIGITNCSLEKAKETLEITNGNVKLAVVMILLKVDVEKARELLQENQGFIDKIV